MNWLETLCRTQAAAKHEPELCMVFASHGGMDASL